MADEQVLDRETLKHRIEEVAPEALPHVRMGYHILAQQTPEQRRDFIRFLLEATESGRRLDRERATEIAGLNSRVISDVLSAIGLSLGAVIDLNVETTDFIDIGKGVLFSDEDRFVAEEVVTEVVARREGIRAGMNSSSLANAVLPSFRSWSSEVDLRIEFADDSNTIKAGIPVSVNYISTDTDNDLWFQASVDDLERIVDNLSKLVEQMRKAEGLVSVLSK